MYGDDILFEGLINYYATSQDRGSKVVDFLDGRPSQFLGGSEYISSGKADFTIIDSFGGAAPIVLDYKFLVQRQEKVDFMVEIFLDSNVVSYLHQYVTDCSGLFRSSHRGVATL